MESKYKTTKENPIFKEGIIIRKDTSLPLKIAEYCNPSEIINVGQSVFNKWLEKGYIKEVEEKEFTKSDIIEFFESASYHEKVIADFNDWLKQRDK